MRFDSDYIDECCEDRKGHTNWAYADTVSKEVLEERTRTDNLHFNGSVVFFDEDCCHECDELISVCDCGEEH